MWIMAKPNVWRADIHLTDRIIVRLTFYRLITETEDSLSVFLPLCLCLPLCFTTPGDFEGSCEGRTPVLIAHICAHLVDQLTCPPFSLLAQILACPRSSNRWFSRENTICYLPTTCAHLPYFPLLLLPCQISVSGLN